MKEETIMEGASGWIIKMVAAFWGVFVLDLIFREKH
jgi:hypothetical protein